MSGKHTFDFTPDQREIALYRDAKRKQLRELYFRDSGHPTKSLLFDTGFYRFAAAKTSLEMHFVPTVKNFLSGMGVILGLITLTAVGIKTHRDMKEHSYRTGQVAYADRAYKIN